MDHLQRIIFLYFVIISSTADPLKTLTATVGGSITLPESVVEKGYLFDEKKILAQVRENKQLEIDEENFKERLHWNQNTGYFTLTGLQKSDSGIYKIESKKGRAFSVDYKLVVYDSVPTPKVSVLTRSSESCSLSCSVDSAQEDVTLLWSKDLKVLKKNDSAASLPLTLFYHQDLNSSLHCVAENPAENKTVSVNVRTFCQLNREENTSSSRHHLILIVVPIACGVILLLLVCVIWWFRHRKKSAAGQTDVVYTDIIIAKRDTRGEISQESPEPGKPKVMTIYDKVKLRHTDNAEHA